MPTGSPPASSASASASTAVRESRPPSTASASAKRESRPRASAKREGRPKSGVIPTRKSTKERRRRKSSAGRGAGKRREKAARTVASAPEVEEGQGPICPICHDEYGASAFPVVHAPCGHVACAPCSLKWQQKKSARTCALCRSPVLSIAHCALLEQLMEKKTSDGDTAAASSQEVGEEREEMKKSLQELSQGDLNNLPGDYRSHIVRAVATRAIRKADMTMLTKCLEKYKARPSTNLFCEIVETWKEDPRPPISLLLASGARVNGHCEERPLLCAVMHGDPRAISVLLEMKADPLKPTGPAGETALHIAARAGRFEAVRLLLDHGVPADQPDRFGRTPLFLAEKGKNMHQFNCHVRGRQNCSRCEARIQVYGELKWRARAAAPSAAGAASEASPAAGRSWPDVPAAVEEEDKESEQSSSEWSDSESMVSNFDPMSGDDEGGWEEGDEEEEEGEEEEDGEY